MAAPATAPALRNLRIAKPASHEAGAYTFVERIFDQLGRLVPQRVFATYNSTIVFLALQLQRQQNAEDREWLETIDLPDDLRSKLQGRFIDRGACWLEFTERLTGFDGDYRTFRSRT